jgi:hypothetical protein
MEAPYFCDHGMQYWKVHWENHKWVELLIASCYRHCGFVAPRDERQKHCTMCVGIFGYLILMMLLVIYREYITT